MSGGASSDDLMDWAERRDLVEALRVARIARSDAKRALRVAIGGQKRRRRQTFESATARVLELETQLKDTSWPDENPNSIEPSSPATWFRPL